MTTETNWNELLEEHEMAYFRAGVCLESPESYSLEEKAKICEDMDASTKQIDALMRKEFSEMPPEMLCRMLDMLAASGVECREWWENILLPFDELPDAPPVVA